MKRIIFSLLFFVFSSSVIAQSSFDLALKAGLNNSKVTFKKSEINAESIIKYHVGAFARIGFGRIFVQPEAYFSAKGGKLEGEALDIASSFNFNSIDVPLLLGVKIIDGERANLRLMGGPVFSVLTSNKIEGDDLLEPEYYKDNYIAFQYGVGADLMGFTIDFRMENGANIYKHQVNSDLNGKNSTFMISLGYKIF
jgi:hypothetical protein